MTIKATKKRIAQSLQAEAQGHLEAEAHHARRIGRDDIADEIEALEIVIGADIGSRLEFIELEHRLQVKSLDSTQDRLRALEKMMDVRAVDTITAAQLHGSQSAEARVGTADDPLVPGGHVRVPALEKAWGVACCDSNGDAVQVGSLVADINWGHAVIERIDGSCPQGWDILIRHADGDCSGIEPSHITLIELEPTRLELQARGLLEGIEVGDWVIRGFKYEHATLAQVVGFSTKDYLNTVALTCRLPSPTLAADARLATPAELLEAGIIDEIPNSPKISDSSPVDANGKPINVGDKVRVIISGRTGTVAEVYPSSLSVDYGDGPTRGVCGTRLEVVNGPVDAIGEALEVGDLVEGVSTGGGKELLQVREVYDTGRIIATSLIGSWNYKGSGKSLFKISGLSAAGYLPLARRTLDPELTDRERLAMLAMGCIGEAEEVRQKSDLARDSGLEKEIGDLIWYAEILADECERQGIEDGYELIKVVNPTQNIPGIVERVKKAIFHKVDQHHLPHLALASRAFAESWAGHCGTTLGEIRYQNIRKLMDRYPDGFVAGGGER